MTDAMFDFTIDRRLDHAVVGPFKKVLHVGAGWARFGSADGIEIVNSDQTAAPGIDRVFNVTERWVAEDSEFDMVLAFHIIEHIPIGRVLDMLKEAKRVLRGCGVLIMEFPDFKGLCEEYLKGNVGIVECVYGHDRYQGDQHRWGYVGPDLVALLHAAGFDRTVVGPGKCYHTKQQPCLRVEATHYGADNWAKQVGNAEP